MEIRLDKWLWAARFFKTRSMAKAAIESGKVHIDGQKAKPSKTVSMGMVLTVRQGLEKKTLIIKALSDQRRGATEATQLYEETEESLQRRETLKEARQLMPNIETESRPNKKQRRQLLKFKTMK
jgi:ribosome-associated heat shock protein Hsp15